MNPLPPYNPDTKWYLAEIIIESKVEGDYTNEVHNNLTLVRADSPEEAYEKALQLGRDSELVYNNTDGEKVSVYFRGLHNLHYIYDELGHGAEVLWEKHEDFSEDKIAQMIRTKEQLNIFAPRSQAEDQSI